MQKNTAAEGRNTQGKTNPIKKSSHNGTLQVDGIQLGLSN
jgi:hypothetical protein